MFKLKTFTFSLARLRTWMVCTRSFSIDRWSLCNAIHTHALCFKKTTPFYFVHFVGK